MSYRQIKEFYLKSFIFYMIDVHSCLAYKDYQLDMYIIKYSFNEIK